MLIFLAITLVQAAPAASAAPPPPACETAEHRQFDFWVGRWDVYRSDNNQLVARSLIEKLYAGCAIRENWMPIGGTGGGSLNSYRPSEKKWRQVWTDSANNLNDYAGGLDEGGAMVIAGTSAKASGAVTQVRMTFRKISGTEVQQIGERSADGGKSWTLDYHFTYRRAAPVQGQMHP